MTAERLPNDTVIKFYLPSLTKDKKEIPLEKREAYIKAIAESFSNLNGGATIIPHCKGLYLTKSNEYDYEEVTIIESFGRNPFSEKEMSILCEQLNQECVMTITAGNNTAYLFSAEEPKATANYTKVIYSDGSKIVISQETDPTNPKGDPVLLVEHYDHSGRIVDRHHYPMSADEDGMLEITYMPDSYAR